MSSLVKLSEASVSNVGSVTLTGITSAFNVAVVYYSNVVPANDAADLQYQFTEGGTANGNTCSHTRGIFMGGRKSPTFYNIIDYINMQSLGNAMDFGDTTGVDLEGAGKLAYTGGTSDCHGGLGGY